MKILHISYIYPPKLNVADGITNVAYTITNGLSRRGHQVSIFTSNLLDLHSKQISKENKFKINGVNVYYCKYLFRYKTFIFTPAIIQLLQQHIKEFDIIHIHDCRSFQGIVAYVFAKINKKPYVFQPHGSFLYSPSNSSIIKFINIFLDNLISKNIVMNASKLIVLSLDEAVQYKKIHVPNERILILPNGIDLSIYEVLPPKNLFKKKYNILSTTKIILYLGRIHNTKGLDLLFRSFTYILQFYNTNDIVLVIAGPDDGQLAHIKKLGESLGISSSVIFTGFISDEDKIKALIDATVFVTPSFYGFPITFLESCVVGTPIVTTTLHDSLDWIHNKVGFVTDPNYIDFGNAICKILNNVELRNKFSNNCCRLKYEFSLEKVLDRLENTYSSLSIEFFKKCNNNYE